jgi:hypothetical protein
MGPNWQYQILTKRLLGFLNASYKNLIIHLMLLQTNARGEISLIQKLTTYTILLLPISFLPCRDISFPHVYHANVLPPRNQAVHKLMRQNL